MYRDFSEKSKNELIGLVSQVENEKISNFTDWVGDRWYDFESWIGKLNIKNYLNNVNEYHKKVIDKNNTTKSTIETIFNAVKNVDNKYYLVFKDTYIQLVLLEKYIQELSEIVNPANGIFNSDYISSSMSDLLEKYITYVNTQGTPNGNMYEKLIQFDATSLFIDSRNTTEDAIAIGWTGDWMKNFLSATGVDDWVNNSWMNKWLEKITGQKFNFNIENVNETIMRKSIEAVISSVLVNKHDVEDFYDSYTKALMPEEVEIGKKIIGLSIDAGEIYSETEIANLLKIDVKDITESDYLKWLCQSDNLKFLKDISDKIDLTIGTYGDAVDILDISTQLLTKVFNDYTEDTRYLEAIKQSLIDGGYDNKTVNDVVDNMLWEYRNQYMSAAVDGIEKLAEMGIDKGVDKVLPLLDVFIETKDISSSIIGLTDTTDNLGNIYATQQYSYGLVEKYEFYRQKINSGNYTQSDVEQCNTYFELAKAAKLQEYKAIKTVIEDALNSVTSVFHSSEDKQYTRDILAKIDAEIERLESLSL